MESNFENSDNLTNICKSIYLLVHFITDYYRLVVIYYYYFIFVFFPFFFFGMGEFKFGIVTRRNSGLYHTYTRTMRGKKVKFI